MKKTLLGITCIFACIFSIQAQSLYGTTYGGGTEGTGTINKFTPGTNNLIAVKSFESFAANPYYTNFVQTSDGKLYGITAFGGSANYGAVFSFDPSSSTYTKLKDLDDTNGAYPYGSLVLANDGKLYGMTNAGGTNGDGVIFSFDPSTSIYTKLKDFDDTNGAAPYGSLLQASDGKLYGLTSRGGSNDVGVIFSFDLSTSSYTKLLDFDNTNGASPTGSLIQAGNGKLYGMTNLGGNGYGVIFSFDPDALIYTKLDDFDFDNNGAYPNGSLLQAGDGKLYGLTYGGGSNFGGVIFSFDPSGAAFTKLWDFNNSSSINAFGNSPYGSLIQAGDGKLYGTTSGGGANQNAGVIFSFDPLVSTYTTLKSFEVTDGSSPLGSLMQAGDGKLYGMTTSGGSSSVGVIFSFDLSVSSYNRLKDFGSNETGRNPTGSLVEAGNGKLFGMATSGGNNNMGVIFSFDPLSSTYTKVKDFDYPDGANPYGGFIQATDGKLYAMTYNGGSNGYGVIFSFDPSTSTYTKLKDLDNINGANPYGNLLQASDGKLYGMTSGGGTIGGVIFSFDPATSTYVKLKEWMDISEGAQPYGSLIQANDGKFYGMTNHGGYISERDAPGQGVIFSFEPSGSAYTKLKEFNDEGYYPYGSLIQGIDGKLYGETAYGGYVDGGTIFSFDPLSSTYLKLKDLDSDVGSHPFSSLMQASDGKLYGTTFQGGSSEAGVIFSFEPSTSTYTKLQDYTGANGANPYLGSVPVEVHECTTSKTYYQDADGDGFGNLANFNVSCSQPDGYVENNTDCNDANPAVHPGATEVCNGIDDNCDGLVDEGLATTFYSDADGDGYGNAEDSTQACSAPVGYVTNNRDCDDGNASVHPGARELHNGIDDDCNGQVDEHRRRKKTFYRDADGDGYGNASKTKRAFLQPPGYVRNNTDCDDTRSSVHPGAREICNGIDDDCDGLVDEGVKTTFYRDADCDGYGNPNNPVQACSKPAGYVRNNYDCDDQKKAHRPWNESVLMCHKGIQECVPVKDIFRKLFHGWRLGPCPQTCGNISSKQAGATTMAVKPAILSDGSIPRQYKLSNYPNPFAGISTIKYELPFDSRVSIKVYDLLGRVVTTLVEADKKAGTYTVEFKAGPLSKGSLYYRIIAKSKENRFEQTNKMIRLQ